MPDRFKNIRMVRSQTGKPYYINPIYPDTPLSSDDTYVITAAGDRYDLLAEDYYQDNTLWWVIACANTSKRDSLYVKPGIQLRIPYNPLAIKTQFELINSKR